MSEGVVSNICAPALVYLSFSLIQIVIDIYKNQFYTAFFKFWTMLIFTTLLNILCERGLEVVSWMFVFIPIITMTILLVVLIYFLGFNPGQINKKFNVTAPPKIFINPLRNIAPPFTQPTVAPPIAPPIAPTTVPEHDHNADIIKQELALQKKVSDDTELVTPTDVAKITESFSMYKKFESFNPSDF